MKEEHIDIDRMVMSARYLHALDIEDSRSDGSLSDMERKDYMDTLSSLRESNDRLKEMVSDLRDTIRSLKESMALRDKRIADLTAALSQSVLGRQASDFSKDKQISDLHALVSELRASLAYANEKLAIRNRDKFDRTSRSDRNRKNKKDKKKSREEEKEDHDGLPEAGSSPSSVMNSVVVDSPASSEDQSVDRSKVTSENLNGKRGPRGKYTTMDTARVVEHKTALMAEVPEGWRFIDYKRIDEFTKISYIRCDRFTVAVYEDDFGVRHEYYSPLDPQTRDALA